MKELLKNTTINVHSDTHGQMGDRKFHVCVVLTKCNSYIEDYFEKNGEKMLISNIFIHCWREIELTKLIAT
jgi:hypothetical protein